MKTAPQFCLSIVSAGLLCSCACQIQPPPSVRGTDKEGAAKAAASALPGSISNAEISGNYKSVVNETYVTVGQDDVAFFLLLQAYNCESRRGHMQQAEELLRLAREELARRHNAPAAPASANPPALTKTEQKVLQKSPLKQEIASKIAAKPTPAPATTAAAPGKAKVGTKGKGKAKPKATPSPTPSA